MRRLIVGIQVGIVLLIAPLDAFAGAVLDADGDLVPDQFDNCNLVANGPNQTTNQIDSDLDGYGNRCDADLNQDCATTAADFADWLGSFGTRTCGEFDFDGNCTITTADFAMFLGKFSGTGAANAPGPSGLICADCRGPTVPCIP